LARRISRKLATNHIQDRYLQAEQNKI
jgi:hypothetical protein